MCFLQHIKKIPCFGIGMSLMIFIILSSIYLPNAHSTELLFVNKTIEAGLTYPLSPSYGLSWGDFNNDTFIDVFIINHGVNPPSLYQNLGDGAFKDITNQAGLNISGDFHGASWGDFDNDGDLDLYQVLGAFGGHGAKTNYLFQNNGNGLFTDIASSAGLQDPKGRGRTPLWLDYNNDGKLDLFIANLRRVDGPSVLLRNEGSGLFSDVTESAGLQGIESAEGVYIADINSDGILDLLLAGWRIYLYLNNGDGTFKKVTSASGLSTVKNVHDLALGDYDNDGDIDIFVARGPNDVSDVYESDIDKIYSSLSIKAFEKGFDFKVDNFSMVEYGIYMYKDKISVDLVYIGSGKYHPVNIPFSLDPASIQNQGKPELTDSGIYIWFDLSDNQWHIRYIYIENGGGEFKVNGTISAPGSIIQVNPVNLEIDTNNYTNLLLQNSGNGQFVDATAGAGLLQDFGNARSAVFADFDNDGNLDLYVVYTGGIFNEANKLYVNDGQGHFTDVAASAGAQALVEGRGESVAVADYNNDGFLDMIVLNGLGEAPFHSGQRVLLENQGTNNNWIQLKLDGIAANRDGIGSTVTLEAGALTFTRQQTGGMHLFSQNSQVLQFGLGNETLIGRITINWPSGIVQQLSNIAVNQRLVIEEPSVSLNLIPDAFTVTRGGNLRIKAIATNNTGEVQVFKFAANVTKPDGIFYPPLPAFFYGPIQITLAPHKTRYGYITHYIPINTPLGGYIYNGYVGKGMRDIWNEEHFKFTVN